MTAYQLPDDVGQNAVTRNGEVVQAEGSFPSGQKEGGKSLPVVLPKENYTLNIDNYRHKTEVDRDLLGFPRQTRPYNFLTKDDQFELSKVGSKRHGLKRAPSRRRHSIGSMDPAQRDICCL